MQNSKSTAFHVFGNGRMLVYGEGASIRSLQGPDYSSPPFCSLVPCLHDGNRSDSFISTERIQKTNIRTHRISFSSSRSYPLHDRFYPDITLTDLMDPKRCVFLRSIESFVKFRHRIIISRGARYSIVRAYPIKGRRYTVGIITIPRGTAFYAGECSKSEYRMLIIPTGEAAFSDSGCEIISDAGASGILFITGDSCEEIINSAAGALSGSSGVFSVKESKLYHDCSGHWRCRLSLISDISRDIPQEHRERERILRAAEDTAVLLLCHTSEKNALISGCERPVMLFNEAPAIIRALSALGYTGEAGAILSFIFKLHEGGLLFSGGESSRLSASPLSASLIQPGNASGGVSLPSSIINAVFAYYEQTGDERLVKELFPMLIQASEELCRSVSRSFPAFSGGERCFEYGIAPLSIVPHASFEAAMQAVHAAGIMLAFVRKHALRKRSLYYAPLEQMLPALEASCRARFYINGYIYSNDFLHESGRRRPRFRYGYCEGCAAAGRPVYQVWLERTKSGRYVCPACYSLNEPEKAPSPGHIRLCSSQALPAFHTGKLFTRAEKAALVEPHLLELAQRGFVPSLPGGELMQGGDPGGLLGAFSRVIEPAPGDNLNYESIATGDNAATAILNLADEAGVWAGLYDGAAPVRDRSDPYASAKNIAALLDYMKLCNKYKCR